MIKILGPIAIAVLLLVFLPAQSIAQGLQLSPAQQQMLDSLPAQQRQQALSAIRQLGSQQEQTTQPSINEPVQTSSFGYDSTEVNQAIRSAAVTAAPRSRLVVEFSTLETLTAPQLVEIEEDPALQKLSGKHLFVLDNSGVLSLHGISRIPLLGLSELDIERRLSAEPYLASFNIDARILEQTPIGVEALQPFGYDIFDSDDSDFDSPGSGPVPPQYILGPGDSIRVQFFGNVNGIYEYEVARDGVLSLPEIGPVTVAGMSFSEFHSDISTRVQQTLIGTQVSVTLGQLRTIRVFVLGDVKQPGSYVVSGLSTISAALYRSGGVSSIGSLRDIQLKRNGQVVSRFDAYDLLVRGNNSRDVRVQQGDVIFVPPIGKTVSVGGAVRRPAIYEVRRLTTAQDVIALAGGLTPEAFAAGATLERIAANGQRTVVAVNVRDEAANELQIMAGDTLFVPEVLPEVDNAVTVAGHVYRPGRYPWIQGMRLSDVISSTDELKPGFDNEYVLIRRENKRGDPVDALSASLAAALATPGSVDDVQLLPGDTINVFSFDLGRQRVVGPILDELERQSTVDSSSRQVQISGNVRAPGVYPLEATMRVSDLIRAGGNLAEDAYALEAELTRYSVIPGRGRESKTQTVDLAAIRAGDVESDILLQPHDYLIVSRVPDWGTIWTVSLEGEVRFPGEYRVSRGDSLADVIERAGGLTDAAFPEGAVFLRESLREQEQEQLRSLAQRMEADLASLSLQAANDSGTETMVTGKVLLDQLRATDAVGRLVIDLDRSANGSSSIVKVRDGDRLIVPTQTQMVTVIGETQQNTSHLYGPGMSRDDYIQLSGGLTRRADKKLIYVVRANGAVVPNARSKWFGRSKGNAIRPGDTIVVPLDTDRMRPLTFWGNVTQILYQGAIAIAAVKTFDN